MADEVIVRFYNVEGESTGPAISIPENATPKMLQSLVNEFTGPDDQQPYQFYVYEKNENDGCDSDGGVKLGLEGNRVEIQKNVRESVDRAGVDTEDNIMILCVPQSAFKVRPVSRCTNTMAGHTESILVVQHSPCGRFVASGGGDKTVRIWDMFTFTPIVTLAQHNHWVLSLAWSPDGSHLASGDMDGGVCVWSVNTWQMRWKKNLHRKWVTSLSWEPLHIESSGLDGPYTRGTSVHLASGSKDGTVVIVHNPSQTIKCRFSSTDKGAGVTKVIWSGEGVVYSASQDRVIRVWTVTGAIIRVLSGHGHWVNSIAVDADYTLRAGPFANCYDGMVDHTVLEGLLASPEKRFEFSVKNYSKFRSTRKVEVLASASDDFTMMVWHPLVGKRPVSRSTGHQGVINTLAFAPTGDRIATASFDKSIRVWHSNGKFISTLRGHVGAIFQLSWSGDGRMLASGGKDSMVKVWNIGSGRIVSEMSGHSDEVYTIDWCVSGDGIASGSKDKTVKIWKH